MYCSALFWISKIAFLDIWYNYFDSILILIKVDAWCKIQAKHDKEGDKKLTKSRQSISSKTLFEVSFLRTNTSSSLLRRRETPDFISADLWPPNSPDLNPVDYEIWAVMQRRVYQRKIHTIDELKQRLIEVWCGFEQSTVDMAIVIFCWNFASLSKTALL